MSFFWFLFPLFVVLFAYFGDESKTKNRNISRYSCFFLLITLSVVLATCGSVFIDHKGYMDLYYYFGRTNGIEYLSFSDFFLGKNEGINSPIENGFALLNWVIYKFNFSHVGLFFILGAITNHFIIKSFYRFKYPAITFLTYIISVHFQQEFNLVRQMMAVAMIFYALRYVEEHNWKKYLLFLTIAFTIHQSSAIMLIFTPLCFVKDYDKLWKYVRLILVGIYSISVCVAFKIIPLNLGNVALLFNLYEGHLSNKDIVGAGDLSIDFIYNTIVILTLWLYRKKDEKLIYMIVMTIGCTIDNLSIQAPNFSRLALYFSIAYLPLAPNLLGDCLLFKKKNLSEVALILFTLFNSIRILRYIVLNNNIIGSQMESFFNLFL